MSTSDADQLDRPYRILVGCTGSVATIKAPLLCAALQAHGFEVWLICTEEALHFLHSKNVAALPPGVRVFTDKDEWESWQERGDTVMHIHLRNWSDVLLLAPLSANSLAKISNGLCDNLLTCVVRAWPIGQKSVVFAPAMNTDMYNHPLTAQQITVLRNTLKMTEVEAVSKTLICGQVGVGAMAEVETIVNKVCQNLPQRKL